ncbi:MAG TPA: DoxX family protein, partial [Pirellulaceae bacterium]|nr:DoxX family protein [Pirellulaceae bacterium]
MHDSTATTSPSSTAAKAMLWVGWVLTILPALGLIMSAAMKLAKPAFVVEGFMKSGYPENVLLPLGIVELTCTII